MNYHLSTHINKEDFQKYIDSQISIQKQIEETIDYYYNQTCTNMCKEHIEIDKMDQSKSKSSLDDNSLFDEDNNDTNRDGFQIRFS